MASDLEILTRSALMVAESRKTLADYRSSRIRMRAMVTAAGASLETWKREMHKTRLSDKLDTATPALGSAARAAGKISPEVLVRFLEL
ncbi:MAG TPA: hypothetical protein VG796_16620 [Verrucomicrobiales bacterium]|jgi:hypothetical protein|nr:hypothetical protein [Verrucomicrobiales bacterium]